MTNDYRSTKPPCKPPEGMQPTKFYGKNILGQKVMCWGYTWICTDCSQKGFEHFMRYNGYD